MKLNEAKTYLESHGYICEKNIDEGFFGNIAKKAAMTAALIGGLLGGGTTAMAHPATTGEQPQVHDTWYHDVSPKSMQNKINKLTSQNKEMKVKDVYNVAMNIEDIVTTVKGEADSSGFIAFNGGKARKDYKSFTVVFDNGCAAKFIESDVQDGLGYLIIQDTNNPKETTQRYTVRDAGQQMEYGLRHYPQN